MQNTLWLFVDMVVVAFKITAKMKSSEKMTSFKNSRRVYRKAPSLVSLRLSIMNIYRFLPHLKLDTFKSYCHWTIWLRKDSVFPEYCITSLKSFLCGENNIKGCLRIFPCHLRYLASSLWVVHITKANHFAWDQINRRPGTVIWSCTVLSYSPCTFW